jgi:predicted HAD superfamily Cof-like phosphohydrolase
MLEEISAHCRVCGILRAYRVKDILAAFQKDGDVRAYCENCYSSQDLGGDAVPYKPDEPEEPKENKKMPLSDHQKIDIAKARLASLIPPAPRQRSGHQQSVDLFMQLAEQEVPNAPKIPDEKTRILRAKLILEEALETIRLGLGVEVVACGNNDMIVQVTEDNLRFCPSPEHMPNLEQIADGCADIKVVTTGTLSACGIADLLVQHAVDCNNLKKFSPGGKKREDGKWQKPPDHKPPDIQAVLDQQKA